MADGLGRHFLDNHGQGLNLKLQQDMAKDKLTERFYKWQIEGEDRIINVENHLAISLSISRVSISHPTAYVFNNSKLITIR